MQTETCLNSIKRIAKTFLYITPVFMQGGFVSHPYAQHQFQAITNKDGTRLLNISNETDLDIWLAYMSNVIDSIDNVHRFHMIISKPYLATFLNHTAIYFSQEDYSKFLSEMWTTIECPNNDPNVSKFQFIQMFKQADKDFLMEKSEKSVFDSLPDTITIYRGIQLHAKKEGLSWTLDKRIADWFANRFEHHGDVITATIKKEYVLAYFNRRNESEVVVDYRKIQYK